MVYVLHSVFLQKRELEKRKRQEENRKEGKRIDSTADSLKRLRVRADLHSPNLCCCLQGSPGDKPGLRRDTIKSAELQSMFAREKPSLLKIYYNQISHLLARENQPLLNVSVITRIQCHLCPI